MFIKIIDRENELVVNMNSISSIVEKPDGYEVIMNNNTEFLLNKQQYDELYKILTKTI